MTERTSLVVHLLLLAALCGVLYFPYLGRSPFFDKGEPREGLAVQDIVQRGEWLFPLKRATAIPSKPPLFHWSAALTYQATGRLNEATIRFPSAFYATLGVLLLYLLGRKLYGGEIGLPGHGAEAGEFGRLEGDLVVPLRIRIGKGLQILRRRGRHRPQRFDAVPPPAAISF